MTIKTIKKHCEFWAVFNHISFFFICIYSLNRNSAIQSSSINVRMEFGGGMGGGGGLMD